MGYVIQFIIGGSVMLLATILSQSKYLFLSGVITLLPILTLLNLKLQVQHMSQESFHETQRNGIIGAVGMVILVVAIYIFSSHFKPSTAVLMGIGLYVMYMFGSKLIVA
ncbi:GlpM family protein [Kurthia gibsonii]|uniref:GlpM family protein n=1 Tax=Kurthia gibsonii TaxID=33946 RepID=UPI0011438262|nr:GlpM family protein [Kurthia gibsonii]GED20375.1 hypothetical protein KGI01_21160 [Kurthia gibsonii]